MSTPLLDPAPDFRPDLAAAPLIGDIEDFLQAVLTDLAPDATAPPGVGRPRILPSLCLWGGLLVCVLRGFTRQAALWRLLTLRGLWHYPRFALSDQAVYDRLAADGLAPMARLLAQVSAVLAQRLAPYTGRRLAPFATAVLAMDESTLDAVATRLPAADGGPPPRRLPGKLSAVFDIRRQQWWRVLHQPHPHQNEKVAARDLVADAPRGSLFVFDLGYFAFAWLDHLTAAGQWWVCRLREKTSYRVVHTFYHCGDTFDGLVWLGAYRADRARFLVRLVEFRVGATRYRYLTNVTDPRQFTVREIAAVYQRRWDIELAFNLIKTHLGLHLLWSGKDEVILQQVWAVLIIAQVLQALRMEIAGRAEVDPYEVSLALVVQYAPQLAADGQDVVAVLVERGRAAGIIRPSRRTANQAPHVPHDRLIAAPPDLVWERTPRYAGRD
ncbi:MAG: IS4 family transposase [Dehalococcoidia bacterium]